MQVTFFGISLQVVTDIEVGGQGAGTSDPIVHILGSYRFVIARHCKAMLGNGDFSSSLYSDRLDQQSMHCNAFGISAWDR